MKRWEYTSADAFIVDNVFEILSRHGQDGWEAWYMARTLDGVWVIYFKRPIGEIV